MQTLSNKLIQRARRIVEDLVRTSTQSIVGQFKGRGIVTCAGGHRYFTNAWILIKMLRHLGCDLPIQLWYLGPDEVSDRMKRLVSKFGVECVDGTALLPKNSYNRKGLGTAGWILKSVAIARCPFDEVMFLDADNLPVRNPSFLFTIPQYRETGTLFWPDTRIISSQNPLWKIFGLPYVEEPEVESGQLVVNKNSCWQSLVFAEQLNLSADVFYCLAYGGKDLFRFAWRKTGKSYAMPQSAPQMLTVPDFNGEATDAVLCQQDFAGDRLFQHRMFCKWDLFAENPWVSGFFFESQCHKFLEELKSRWDGRCDTNHHGVKSAALLTCEKSLVNNNWILEFPEPPSGKSNRIPSSARRNSILEEHLPDFVKAPHNVGSVKFAKSSAALADLGRSNSSRLATLRAELKFAPNGTIKQGGSEQTGCFWNISERSGKKQLHLSAGDGKIVSLKWMNENLWKGRGIKGLMGGRNAKLLSIQDSYPQLAGVSRPRLTQRDRAEILKSLGKRVHVKCSSVSAGDHVLAAYACTGLSRLGVHVIFHTPHSAWLSRVTEPGLTIKNLPRRNPAAPAKESESWRDLNHHYGEQLRYGKSRISWYAGNLHRLLKPAKPAVNVNEVVRKFPFDKYVVFAPFPLEKVRDRSWPETHWARLANLIRESGYEIVAIGREEQAPHLLRTFSQTQTYWVVGHEPGWMMDVLLGATAYVGIDHDVTYLAVLLQIKSIVIHSQLPSSFLWPNSTVQSIVPNTDCALCRWQRDRGHFSACDSGCSALGTISPEAVAEKVLAVLDKKDRFKKLAGQA